jgi:hypothetical protein
MGERVQHCSCCRSFCRCADSGGCCGCRRRMKLPFVPPAIQQASLAPKHGMPKHIPARLLVQQQLNLAAAALHEEHPAVLTTPTCSSLLICHTLHTSCTSHAQLSGPRSSPAVLRCTPVSTRASGTCWTTARRQCLHGSCMRSHPCSMQHLNRCADVRVRA